MERRLVSSGEESSALPSLRAGPEKVSPSLEHRSFSLTREKPSIFLNECSSVLKPKDAQPLPVAQLVANLFATQLLWTADADAKRSRPRPKPLSLDERSPNASPQKKMRSFVLEGITSPQYDRPKPAKVVIDRVMTGQVKPSPHLSSRFAIDRVPPELTNAFKE